MRGLFRSHRLVAFVVLAFLLSWYPWLIALARGTTTGPNPLGPFVAALIVLGVASGWAGIRELLRNLVRVRIKPIAWLVAIALPLALCAITAMIAATFASGAVRVTWPPAAEMIEKFLFIFLFIALGEEPGWRGFALPELQRRHSPLRASLILGAIWAVWHLPLMGNEFPWSIVPAFVIGVFGTTLVQTWLLDRSGGALLPQMILHTIVNTFGAGLVFRWFAPGESAILWWTTAALWLIAGVICIRRLAPTPLPPALPQVRTPAPAR